MSSAIWAFDAYQRWQGLHRDVDRRLITSHDLLQRSSHDRFEQQAIMMRIVGEQILRSGYPADLQEARRLMNRLLTNNRVFSAYAIASPGGEILLTSENIDENVGKSLLENPLTAPSFREALVSDGLVLGDSYPVMPIDRAVLPLRLSIRDASGQPGLVIITAIDILGEFSPWSTDLLAEDMLLTVVKPTQAAGQFMPLFAGELRAANSGQNLERGFPVRYGSPVPAKLTDVVARALEETPGSLQRLETLQEPRLFDVTAEDALQSRSIIGYEPHFKYMIAVSRPLAHIREAMLAYARRGAAFWTVFNLVVLLSALRLFRTETEVRRRLRYQATHDHLTGLPNRYFMDSQFDDWILRYGDSATLVVIDLDNFKSINDHFGHSVGDEVLITTARRIDAWLRGHEIAARYAGDTFAALLQGKDLSEIEARCAELRKRLREDMAVDQLPVSLSASIGIARGGADSTAMELLMCGELALQHAKKERDSSIVFSADMYAQTFRDAQIQNALRRAATDEFHVVYQPQIDAKTGAVVGCEALLRWNSPVLGAVSPATFISIAERCGRIGTIGQYVLSQAVRDIRWLLHSHGQLSVSVNTSIHQFMFSDMLSLVTEFLNDARVPCSSLCIEITESILADDSQSVSKVLRELRERGVEISIDDFGTGYSSLSVLRDTEIDEVKIDASFIRTMLGDCRQRSVVQAIIDLTHSLDCITVAEGVETAEQATLLRELGCDRLQGFLIAKPMRFDDLCAFLGVAAPAAHLTTKSLNISAAGA